MCAKDIGPLIDFSLIDIAFEDKPIVFGGLAMEYYGLREHGDIDLIVSLRDYRKLRARYPNDRKDRWGDFGIVVNGFDMFRSICKFDYEYYRDRSIERDRYRVIDVETLFRLQVYSMLDGDERHGRDVELLKGYFEQFQNKNYRRYMDAHVDRYLAVPLGIICNGEYEEDIVPAEDCSGR